MGGIGNLLTVIQFAVVVYFSFNALNLKIFFGNTITNKVTNKSVVLSVRQDGDILKELILSRPMDLQLYEFKVNVKQPLVVCVDEVCTSRNIFVNETHYQRNFTFNVIDGDFEDHYQFQLHKNIPYPYHNQFYHLYSTMALIESKKVNIKLQVYPISFYKFTLFLHYSASFNELRSILQEKDIDQFKNIFIDTNFYYLLLTLSVSVLHTILDFFAFKNDVLFWKNKKNKEDYKGLSITSIFVSIICQFVILLYLTDTGKTNTVIIASSAAQLAIELWKCYKLVDFSGEKWALQQDEETLKYDKMAFKYMSMIIVPILTAYAAYTLTNESWDNKYSLFIKIMASFVYGFQFTILTPQLFINYHMKSVSHLPWRMLTYKFLGTIVDDLFAFIIEMPTMHRLACFRDDVVFVIAIYQGYIYPTDKTRVNEYGQSFEEVEKAAKETSDKKDKKGKSTTNSEEVVVESTESTAVEAKKKETTKRRKSVKKTIKS